MANPAVVDCPANVWTKVATNVTAIRLRLMLTRPALYSFTYVDTTGAGPSDLSQAVPVTGESLTFAAAADVYIYPHGAAGRVRVDQ